jgi:hypothetical protein
MKSAVHIPHGSDNTSEATEQHRRRKVHRLVGGILISLCGLACAQERQESVGKVELYDVLDREPPVAQQKRAVQRIRVLDTVTSHVQNIGGHSLQQQTHLGH